MRRVFLAMAIAAIAVSGEAAASPAPAEIVGTFHAALLDAMQKGKTLDCERRIGRLAPVIRSTFDLPAIARLAMRRHWAALNADQQQQFERTFEDMVITTYASQFAGYSGETFGAPVAEDLPGGRSAVHSVLNVADGAPVKFDYVLQRGASGWRVVNVLADGVSDLALRSAQYDSVMKSQGFDKLVAGLREQAEKNRAAC
jgi:phospholipid transport system substrate-binding protein